MRHFGITPCSHYPSMFEGSLGNQYRCRWARSFMVAALFLCYQFTYNINLGGSDRRSSHCPAACLQSKTSSKDFCHSSTWTSCNHAQQATHHLSDPHTRYLRDVCYFQLSSEQESIVQRSSHAFDARTLNPQRPACPRSNGSDFTNAHTRLRNPSTVHKPLSSSLQQNSLISSWILSLFDKSLAFEHEVILYFWLSKDFQRACWGYARIHYQYPNGFALTRVQNGPYSVRSCWVSIQA